MTGYKSGAATRRAILLALLAEEPRTIRGLAAAVGISHPGMRSHLKRMQAAGLVTVAIGKRGAAGQARLTAAGREAAKLL